MKERRLRRSTTKRERTLCSPGNARAVKRESSRRPGVALRLMLYVLRTATAALLPATLPRTTPSTWPIQLRLFAPVQYGVSRTSALCAVLLLRQTIALPSRLPNVLQCRVKWNSRLHFLLLNSRIDYLQWSNFAKISVYICQFPSSRPPGRCSFCCSDLVHSQ